VQPDAESLRAVARMMGLLMVDETKHEVFWQLYGNGKNGKTVTLDIIRELVGPHNVSDMPLMGFVKDFKTWPLTTAKANVCGELPTDVGRSEIHAIEGAFKNATSGGVLETGKKYKDVQYIPCRARFILSANSLPTFVDRSDAIWRRLRIIPYPVQIPEEERVNGLAKIIAASDMPGIAAWALEGLAEVIRLGKVPDCPAGDAMKGRHRSNCDHERQFLDEKYERRDGGRVEAQPLYETYRGWMADHGYKAMGAGKFYGRCEEIFPGCEHKRARVGQNLAWVIDGIGEAIPVE
jgi:putative DNA primase/helicase